MKNLKDELKLYEPEEKAAIQQFFCRKDFQKNFFGEEKTSGAINLDQLTYSDFEEKFGTLAEFKNNFGFHVENYGSLASEISFKWNFGEQEKQKPEAKKLQKKLHEALYPFCAVSLGKAQINAPAPATGGVIRKITEQLVVRASIQEASVDFLIPKPIAKAFNENTAELLDIVDRSIQIIHVDAKNLLALKKLFDVLYQFLLHPNVVSAIKIKICDLATVFSEPVFEALVDTKLEMVANYRNKTKWKKIADDDMLAAGLALVDGFDFVKEANYFSFSA